MGFLEGLGKVAKYIVNESVSSNDRQLKNFENECKKRGIDPTQSEKYRDHRESIDRMKEKGFGKR